METALTYRRKGKQMATTRIDRMLRELHSEPSHQFFWELLGLGRDSAKPQQPKPREPGIPVSLLKNAPAR
jgi:adenine-specific DNA glycosylase